MSCLHVSHFNRLLQTDTSVRAKFVALQSSLYSTVVVCVLGGIFFIACSSYIVQDKKRAEELTKLNELRVMEAIEENIQVNRISELWYGLIHVHIMS